METTFSKNSPVGRLYEDIKKHALARGIHQGQLEKEIDVGYVEDTFQIPYPINDPGKISPGEVFEYAYRFKEYHTYLHKHGFPVPFVLDDFDPKTTEDETARMEIAKRLADIKATLAQETKLISGSDDYKIELARRIHEWGLQRTSGFSSNRSRQLTAWESYLQKEGECTEKNAILYYAYEEAGLNPSFFHVDSLPPTLGYFFSLTQETYRNGHTFVGLPIQEGKQWIYADLTGIKKFNPPFIEPVRLTPRQFVQFAYLSNRFAIATEKGERDSQEGREVAATCKTIAPESFFCSAMLFPQSESLRIDQLKTIRMVLEENEGVFLHYPDLKRDIEIQMEALEKAVVGNIEGYLEKTSERMEGLEALAKKQPRVAANQFFLTYETLIQNVQQILKQDEDFKHTRLYDEILKRAKTCIRQSISLDPYFLAPFWSLQNLLDLDPSVYPDLFDLLHQISLRNPRHAVAHYLAVSFGLNAIKGKTVDLTEKDFQKIAQHVAALRRLETDHPMAATMIFIYYLYQRQFQNGIDFFNTYRKKTGAILANHLPHLFWAYLAVNRGGEMVAAFKEIIAMYPDGHENMYEVLEEITENFIATSKPDKKLKRAATVGTVIIDKMEMALKTLNALAEAVIPGLEDKEKAKVLYTKLFFYSLLLESEKYSKLFREKMGAEMTPELETILENKFLSFLDNAMTKTRPIPVRSLRRFERLIPRLSPFLKNKGMAAISLGYVELAIQYLYHDNWQKAQACFERAVQFNREVLTISIYANKIVRELFDPIVNGKGVVTKKLLDRVLLGLELGYPYRDQMDKELLPMLTRGYEILLEHYQALDNSKKVALIKARLEAI